MPPKRATPTAFHHAQLLRRELTPAERKLWSYLRNHQLNDLGFRRQHAIGPFIVDFCCPRQRITIELDGDSHANQLEYDQARTQWLREHYWHELRFTNRDVEHNIDAVLRPLQMHAQNPLPATFFVAPPTIRRARMGEGLAPLPKRDLRLGRAGVGWQFCLPPSDILCRPSPIGKPPIVAGVDSLPKHGLCLGRAGVGLESQKPGQATLAFASEEEKKKCPSQICFHHTSIVPVLLDACHPTTLRSPHACF